MKTKKLLSCITLGVLFSGVAFADTHVLATDETKSSDALALAAGDARVVLTGSQEVKSVVFPREDK